MMMRITTKRFRHADGELNVMKCHSAICEQKGALSPKHLRNRGFALVWTAIVFTVLLLLVGLSLDMAKLLFNVHQLQNATDSAALAGAQIVKKASSFDTRQFTHDLGFANKAEHLEVTLRMEPQPEPFPYPTDWDDPDQVTAYKAAMASFDILIGRWVSYNHEFLPTLDAPNAVQAIARRNADFNLTEPALRALNLIFGPLADVNDANASTLAVAWAYDSGGAGLICLSDPVPGGLPGLQIGGNSDLDIDNGGIHVNSTAFDHNLKDGTWVQPGAKIDAGFINVVGGITPDPDDSQWESIFNGVGYSVLDVTTVPAPEHIPDPLAANMVDEPLAVVVLNDSLDLDYARLKVPELIDIDNGIPTIYQTLEGTDITELTIDFSCSLGPGYYPYGINIGNGAEVELKPTSTSGLGTIFVFGGGVYKPGLLGTGISMTNGSRLEGHGVTVYVTKNFDNQMCGRIDMEAGGLDLSSPGDLQNEISGEFDLDLVQGLNGVAIWQDPTMVDSKGDTPDVKLTGGDFNIAGTLYFPDPIHAFLRGNLGDTGNQILCGSLKLEGGAKVNVNYDGRNEGESGRFCLVK